MENRGIEFRSLDWTGSNEAIYVEVVHIEQRIYNMKKTYEPTNGTKLSH